MLYLPKMFFFNPLFILRIYVGSKTIFPYGAHWPRLYLTQQFTVTLITEISLIPNIYLNTEKQVLKS